MEPINDRVFLAGEAAHETLWGTVAARGLSGEAGGECALRYLGPGRKNRRLRNRERKLPEATKGRQALDRLVERQGQRLGASRGTAKRRIRNHGRVDAVTETFGRYRCMACARKSSWRSSQHRHPPNIVPIPFPCPNRVYVRDGSGPFAGKSQASRMSSRRLFLEDVRSYREAKMAGTRVTPVFRLGAADRRARARHDRGRLNERIWSRSISKALHEILRGGNSTPPLLMIFRRRFILRRSAAISHLRA